MDFESAIPELLFVVCALAQLINTTAEILRAAKDKIVFFIFIILWLVFFLFVVNPIMNTNKVSL